MVRKALLSLVLIGGMVAISAPSAQALPGAGFYAMNNTSTFNPVSGVLCVAGNLTAIGPSVGFGVGESHTPGQPGFGQFTACFVPRLCVANCPVSVSSLVVRWLDPTAPKGRTTCRGVGVSGVASPMLCSGGTTVYSPGAALVSLEIVATPITVAGTVTFLGFTHGRRPGPRGLHQTA